MKNLTILLIPLIFSISCKSKIEKTYKFPIRTVVTGTVTNPIKEESNISLAVNWVGFEQEEFETNLDSLGFFKIVFSTYVPVDAWVVYQTNFLVLLQPGDSLYIEFDAAQPDRPEVLETIKFNGTSAENNRQAAIFQKLYYASNLYIYGHDEPYNNLEKAYKNLSPDKFKTFADSIRKEGINFLDNFIQQYNPNEFVKSWAAYSINDTYFDLMTSYPNRHRKANVLKQTEWNVPITYYDYLKEPLNYEIEKGLHSGYALSSFLDNYLAYIWWLTRDELKVLNDEIQTDSRNQFDSIAINLIIAHTPQGLFRETMITYVLSNFIESSEIEAFEKYKSLAEDNLNFPFLREPLLKRYELLKDKISSADEVKFNKLQALDKFLNGVITNNKDKKVTYIDIWATWCGPCRDEFPYSKILHDYFNDRVEFVFVCIDSGEKAFENTIKEFQLKGTHYFLNKEQSRDFTEQLQINGVPHYILIDKNGNTVSSGFEFRPSEDKTKEKIENLVKG